MLPIPSSRARTLTTGKISVTDYDYTRSRANLGTEDHDYQERAYDNAEAQPVPASPEHGGRILARRGTATRLHWMWLI